MPNLINTDLAQNYRKSAPSTRFGTPELVHATITISNINASDYDTVDGNFANIISIIQKFAEIYAVGAVQFGEGGSSLTVILKAGTVTDPDCNLGDDQYRETNPKAGSLQTDLANYFEESVNVSYTTMYGLQYD